MALGKKIPVAFTFANAGQDWHGGLNYFRSLFLALQAEPGCMVEPVAFFGTRTDLTAYAFPSNVRVVTDTVFDRRSPAWLLNKFATSVFGVPWVTNRVIRQSGAAITSHDAPSGSPALKSIGWIPDFQHLHLPEFFSEAELSKRSSQFRELVKKCDLIVVSSVSALQDLEQFVPGSSAKVRVLRFCAVRPDLDAGAGVDLSALYGANAPYFYLPNQAWAHKNHLTAIRALAELLRERPDVKVICSGSLSDYRNPDHLDKLRAEIAKHGLEERFVLLGLIPYPHIAQLMMQSVAVINPSLFEGWSTTVEEAKALGVPLILSDIAVHREQCPIGEARFFEPLVPASLAAAMRASLESVYGPAERDPASALEAHRTRMIAFARNYERIVSELQDTR